MNAGIEGYKGGEGKIAGRVNVCGAWTEGASRTDPEGIPKKWRTGNEKMARSFHEAMKAESVQKTRRANMKIGMNIFS